MTIVKSKRLAHILFWSVISAAFIGPGTVTTALRAGALYQERLLWAVLFSIAACNILQEASSRITIATGKTIGQVISERYPQKGIFHVNLWLTVMIIFGCAAYQAGNLAGAMEGIRLSIPLDRKWLLLIICLFSGMVLWIGRVRVISRILGVFVILMVLIFTWLAFSTNMDLNLVVQGAMVPRFPIGSNLYLIGLIGTTIVPYNLFLGSGMSHGRDLKQTRFGLFIAILIGGFITFLIVISGTLIRGDFTFLDIAGVLEERIGIPGKAGFSLGLFAAGITSGITAPLAAAITGRSLYENKKDIDEKAKNRYFLYTWMGVLLIGAGFTLLNYRPVVLIILAQAFNGLILPFVAISLFLILNDRNIMKDRYTHSLTYNLIMLAVIGFTVFLGLFHFINVSAQVVSSILLTEYATGIASFLSVIIIGLMVWNILNNGSDQGKTH